MLVLGARSQLFPGSPAAVAQAFRQHGLGCVELTPGFVGLPFKDPADFQPARCREAVRPFLDAGVFIAAVNGNTNLLDADLERRHRGLTRLHAVLRHAHDFGTRYVVTETGSLSAISPYGACPENQTLEAREEFLLILAEALAVALEHGVTLLLKPHPQQLLAGVEDALWLQRTLPGSDFGFVLDPAALLTPLSPERWAEDLALICRQLAPVAPLVHAKDLRPEGIKVATPQVGEGMLDYAGLFRILRELGVAPPVILEHVQPRTLTAAVGYLRPWLT
jgi:sugar phosphate isomerase/epimerase